MQKFPVILDLETKHTFREFSEPEKLGVTVVAVYDYATKQGGVYREGDLRKVFSILEKASYIIGYNIRSFDLPVLRPYYPGKIEEFLLFDMLEDVREQIGRRIGLNDLASATLGEKKSGHGLMAIDYYKEGKWAELEKYCMDDVMVTKKLFDYGLDKGTVYYTNEHGKIPIKVNWRKYMEDGGRTDMPMTLPF